MELYIIRPSTIMELKIVYSISLSSYDGLCMKEIVVSISKYDPLFSRFLVSMNFILAKNVIIFILKLFFPKDMMEGINSIKVLIVGHLSIFFQYVFSS